MAAVLAGADRPVAYIVDCLAYRGGRAFVFLPPERGGEQAENQSRDEEDDPGNEVDNPPPPSDGQPLEAAMALLPVFGFCCGCRDCSAIFLKGVGCDIVAAAFRTFHASESPLFIGR